MWLHSGRFWMVFWICVAVVMLVWSVLTAVFWLDSTKNINALSVVANMLASAAGLQASLAMRKADNKDQF